MDTMSNSMIGHNDPPIFDEAAIATFSEQTDKLANNARDWLQQGIVRDEDAGRLKDLVDAIKTLKRDAENHRKDDKQQWLDNSRAVDDAYRPITTKLDGAAKALGKLQDEFARRKQAEEDERRRLAQAEAERKARELEAARRQADADPIGGGEALRKAEVEAKQANADAQERTVQIKSASGLGKASSLRTRRECTIVDFMKAARAFKNDQGVIDAIVRAANAQVRAKDWDGKEIPGIEVSEIKTVV